MSTYLDLDTWPRRAHFALFRQYERPHFNVCVPVDVTELRRVREAHRFSFFLAYHYLTLRAANAIAPFRYRLRGDRVLVHDRLDIGSVVLRDDERFAFCYFDDADDFARFHAQGLAAIAAVKRPGYTLDVRDDRDDLLHCSALPWLAFTSISHARRADHTDAVPKIAFGKIHRAEGRDRMPVSVEVHHALMDGLHVGRFFAHLEASLADPAAALGLDRTADGRPQTAA